MTDSITSTFSRRILSTLPSLARIAFGGVLLLSSMYCLLAYLPTTYFAFIQAPFQGWMPVFARLQGYLFALTFAGVAASLVKEHKNSAARRLTLEFVAFGLAASVYLVWVRPVLKIGNNSLSFVLAIAFLMPLLWMGALNYQAYLRALSANGEQQRWIAFRRVITAAVFIALLYPGAAIARFYASGQFPSLPPGELVAWTWATVTQVLLFLLVFSAIELTARAADRMPSPRRARFVFYTALSWLGMAIAIYRVVLASIPFEGLEAEIYAAMLAMSGVVFGGGWLLRRQVRASASPAAAPKVAEPMRANRREFAALIFFLVAAALTVPALIGAMDWNSVLEKTWSLAYWAMVAAVFVYRQPAVSSRWQSWGLGLMVIASLAGYRLALKSESSWPNLFRAADRDAATALERHAAFDASFQAAREIMAPSISRPCDQHCRFVQQQTNIQPSTSLQLRDVDLVKDLRPTAGKKPNIFIIVVDSLRQDYVSAYNPAVSFTPAMEDFARDSVVFRNAFTRYGGTTLSEPSIWSGTLQLHKHFVQPFHRVNNLEKLTQTDGYKSLITVDTVLRILLEPAPDVVKLDEAAEQWTDVDFCSTGAQAMAKIEGDKDHHQPFFLYTQPQNVHIITLGKTYKVRPPQKKYDGFVDYYASELERLDGCFGSFLQALKARRLYDNSIIVLTADHGEALQEIGTQRHAFSLKPEVIRVPLIIHVPQEIKRTWYYDADAISFNSDVTATLFELLGHGPVVPRPEYGRPLFTATRDEMQKYRRDSYLIASSYGPLYGLLYENGTKLFVENRNEGIEQLFDIARDPGAKHNLLTEEQRRKSEAQLQTDLQGVADLFGYKYKAPTILDWLMR